MRLLLTPTIAAVLLSCVANASAQRTPDRHPDLSGQWTNSTATPLERPPEFAGRVWFTEPEAAEWERTRVKRVVQSLNEEDRLASDVDEIYFVTSEFHVLGDRRTSLIIDPPDGRLPSLLPQAVERAARRPRRSFDDPEVAGGLLSRCLIGDAMGSSQIAPPIVPSPLAQNYYQIIQTPTHVMIYTELIHDARIIKMNATHVPFGIQLWLGDSVGHWEGDTLVVDTTNFTPKTHFRSSGEHLHVVERFKRIGAQTIQYRVTVEDPETWPTPWTADIPFRATSTPILEYACHEGNRAIENFMRGARAEEQRAKEAR